MPSIGPRTARTLLAAAPWSPHSPSPPATPRQPRHRRRAAPTPTAAATTAAPSSPAPAATSATAKAGGKPSGGKRTVISTQHAAPHQVQRRRHDQRRPRRPGRDARRHEPRGGELRPG
ncbi:hypothetical protein ACFQ1I_17585 [Kitasatospora arboriphila]